MSPTTRTGLIAFGIVGGLFLAAAGTVAVAVSWGTGGPAGDVLGPSRPAAGRQGADWTHKELVEYLGTRGVPLRVADTKANDPNGPEVVYWVPDGTHTFTVQRCASKEKARELAGLSPPGKAFAWGRFRIVTGGGSTHEMLRKALAD